VFPERLRRGKHSAARRPTTALGPSWRAYLVIAVVILVAAGCSSRGEGITVDGDGLHVGTSLAKRDQIAQDKANAEIAQIEARTVIEREAAAVSIERAIEMDKVTRLVVKAVGVALAIGLLAIGIGYGGKAAAPLAAEGVAAFKAKQEARASRRLEVILEIGPGGYSARLLTAGYDPEEIAQIVQAAPALDAPRLQALQGRVGDRGMRALVDRGELGRALALLPNPELTEEGKYD